MIDYDTIIRKIQSGQKQTVIDKYIAEIELTDGLDFSNISCKKMISEYIDRFRYFNF